MLEDDKAILKDVKRVARLRMAKMIKNGVSFEVSLKEMLVDAYVQGFIDCRQVKAHLKKQEKDKS